MENLTTRVRELRKKKGWSQERLAEMANLSYSEIVFVETGRRKRPKADTLLAIASALGVSLGELLGESPSPTPAPLAWLPILGTVPGPAAEMDGQRDLGKLPLPLAGLPGGKGEGLGAVRVSGNDLADKGIEAGDYLICGPVGDFEGGRLYLVNQGDMVLARVLGKLGEGLEVKARVVMVYRLRAV